MSTVEFDGRPNWSLDASEAGESPKCSWVGVVEGTLGKKKKTVTASLRLVSTERGRILAPRSIKAINNLLPWRKRPVKLRKYDVDYLLQRICGFGHIFLVSK